MDPSHFFALLVVLFAACEGLSEPRSGRKYDTQYGPPGNDVDSSSEDADDSGSEPDGPTYPFSKGYPAVRKGYYPFDPYWKGFAKGSDATPMKVAEMMMMMDAMDQIRDQEKRSGLSKFLADSKSVLVASAVPLSLILAAVVPVLLNYSMTGQGGTQTVSSTAGGRGARGADGALERIVRNFEETARALDADDCLQRALCRAAANATAGLGPEARRAAAAVAGLVGDEWAEGAGIGGFVSGLGQGSCEEVCGKPARNDGKKH